MLEYLRRLLGSPRSSAAPAPPSPQVRSRQQFEALERIAPLSRAGTADASDSASFVRREPVLGRDERIAGYTFNLQDQLQSRLQGKQDLQLKVYDDLLLRSLASLGIHSLLGHRLAFVGLSPVSLDNTLLRRLPASGTVLMLKPGRQPLAPDQLQPRLQALREAGFGIGWVLGARLLADHPALTALAAQSDYVQFQTAGLDGLQLDTLRRELARQRPAGAPALRLMAQELGAYEEFHLCFKMGFDYFLGDFITSREDWHPPRSEINRALTFKLLNLLREEAPPKDIAQQIAADPVMTFKLLRYLNSPAIGLPSPVATIDAALQLLGRERFFRWLSLLLFDIRQAGFRERLLAEQALTRAYFLEGLAGQGQVPDHPDELFILGLFSMLDLLLGQPLARIVQDTRLPDAVQQALLGAPGIHHDALALARASENPQSGDLENLATACGVDARQVLQLGIDALGKAYATLEAGQA
ncbi:EAL and modified HD-GYP domain-containing signal transduction protein [Oryzisolibacter propanilivorax]|uniref:EAL and modified HD-GYP domain-containing signal transduction protein n=1 Tax=Oryzisolibacter propanilivorax TaxID=1527607 RepID=A0A1G9P5F4_9BURK|nr:HDOD domain-containing protein [Oryzisolibacter propanilivorax]SDL93415.1 EAL and modified HD-GYP domain-containing signal transduction protein [Oryzisolibacter propanilivorax]